LIEVLFVLVKYFAQCSLDATFNFSPTARLFSFTVLYDRHVVAFFVLFFEFGGKRAALKVIVELGELLLHQLVVHVLNARVSDDVTA
jgi:hypothetical protein